MPITNPQACVRRATSSALSTKGSGPAAHRVVHGGLKRGALSRSNGFPNIHLDGVCACGMMRDGEKWHKEACVGNHDKTNLSFTTRSDHLCELISGRV